jgi:hypothetical protein
MQTHLRTDYKTVPIIQKFKVKYTSILRPHYSKNHFITHTQKSNHFLSNWHQNPFPGERMMNESDDQLSLNATL